MMKVDIISIFPGLIESFFDYGVIGRARKNKLFEINCIDLRDFTKDLHRTVDDSPYGGGSGMIMKCEPLFKAVSSVQTKDSIVIYLTPQGETFKHSTAKRLSGEEHLIIICGRYEGVDERFREAKVDLELSIGDYVVSGGELPAMVILDSVLRYIPGVLNSEESHLNDSFENGLLDYAVYTRPREFEGMQVPEVLLSGNHKEIENWRKNSAKERTLKKRPDLLKGDN